jgi:drug/metabolite transporter (DMT)-like permease
MSSSNTKSLLLLHLVVFIFGFTGVLGKLITLPAMQLVWLRMIIGFLGIGVFVLATKRPLIVNKKQLFQYLGIGVIIAIHWIAFFESIKVSTISIALACLSTATLFTAILEPLLFKRKIRTYEIVLGVFVIIGLVAIFKFEFQYKLGIVLSIFCAFLASLFTVINGQLTKSFAPTTISTYEMLGGALALTIFLGITNPSVFNLSAISSTDWMYLLILGLICTAFAFVASVLVMRHVTPFTVALSINLEPVYGILLALAIFGEEEKMTSGFYVGASIILTAVLTNAYFKRLERKKQKASVHVIA